jgi:hypothetical protein
VKRVIDFGSIQQYRNVCSTIAKQARFVGLDENKEPIYDNNLDLPVIKCVASEKIHGSQMGICYSNLDGLWLQSRNNIINGMLGHMGCGVFVESTKEVWIDIILRLSKQYNINLDEKIITIYAEWCGIGIQQNSAVSGLSKRPIIFQHFKVSPIEKNNDIPAYWLETKVNNQWISSNDNNIFNIMNFKTWEVEISFNKPFEAQNKMIKIVDEIESNSPVGQVFGKESNIGEGIVVTFEYKTNLYRFKVKGEKHSATKVKVLNPVDEELENKMIEFANYACKSWRLEQFWNELFSESEPDVKQIGDFLRKVFNDVLKEESDLIIKENLDSKKVSKYISQIARKWFFEQLDKIVIGK